MSELKEIIKKLGFTDKYGVWTTVAGFAFLFCCLGIFAFTPKDPIAYVVSMVGFLSALVIAIVNKNKNENVAKINASVIETSNVTLTDLTDNTVIEEGDESCK